MMPSIKPFLLQFAKEPQNFGTQGPTNSSTNSRDNAKDDKSRHGTVQKPRPPGTRYTFVNQETTDDS